MLKQKFFSTPRVVHQWLGKACRGLFVVSAMVAATHAVAYPAFTNAEVYLRAGPDIDFPIVHVLYPRTLLEVIGCEQDYQWCDVHSDAGRGWISAENLVATFDNREVNVAQNGAAIGLPVLAFLVGAYWANHYVDRPWYNRHPHWNNWHYRPRPPGWRPLPRPPVWRPPPPRPPVIAPGVRPPHVGVVPRPPGGHRPPVVGPGVRPPSGGIGTRPPPGANRPVRPFQPMPERNSR
ncbi:MAG: SH3 domain-containing protein [Comamonadaceae bacterium]|nr:SH3 domain-containing protein [Comamonadaceae bacterium]